ncbi:hypothetical protein B0H14DRAFT_3128540, partial [Mycena olivaceomarginata]
MTTNNRITRASSARLKRRAQRDLRALQATVPSRKNKISSEAALNGVPGAFQEVTASSPALLPSPGHGPTTDIQWLEGEVGRRLYLGNVNGTSLHFRYKTREQIRNAHEVLKTERLLPIQPPHSTHHLELCMAALKNSFRPKSTPGEPAVRSPAVLYPQLMNNALACAGGGTDDGETDADAEGEPEDDEID